MIPTAMSLPVQLTQCVFCRVRLCFCIHPCPAMPCQLLTRVPLLCTALCYRPDIKFVFEVARQQNELQARQI